jgi:hypothetical protein
VLKVIKGNNMGDIVGGQGSTGTPNTNPGPDWACVTTVVGYALGGSFTGASAGSTIANNNTQSIASQPEIRGPIVLGWTIAGGVGGLAAGAAAGVNSKACNP